MKVYRNLPNPKIVTTSWWWLASWGGGSNPIFHPKNPKKSSKYLVSRCLKPLTLSLLRRCFGVNYTFSPGIWMSIGLQQSTFRSLGRHLWNCDQGIYAGLVTCQRLLASDGWLHRIFTSWNPCHNTLAFVCLVIFSGFYHGINHHFSPTFNIWDVIFGTFYLHLEQV